MQGAQGMGEDEKEKENMPNGSRSKQAQSLKEKAKEKAKGPKKEKAGSQIHHTLHTLEVAPAGEKRVALHRKEPAVRTKVKQCRRSDFRCR